MAKINDTTTYPNTPPALTDHVPGTDVSNTANDAAGETVTFTLQGVMDLFEANMAAPTSIIASGTFADARIAETNVTQHEAALTITESQISDLGAYLTTLDLGGLSDVTLTTAAQGHILYRNASGWVNLAPGTSGQYLRTNGAAANPSWATVSGGNVDGGSASSAGDQIQWRRDTAANWTSNNPTLSAGEAGYETDTGFIKVGDGSTAWTSLGYTLSGLADPGADRIVFWDDSAGAQAYLTAGTGLSISGTTMTVTGLTVSEIAAGSLTGSDTDLVTGTAGTSGNLVSWDANGDAVDSSIAAADVAVQAVTENAQTGTTYTLVLGDASKLVSMSNASANTLTIPTNASVAFPVGTTIVVMMKGAGTTTITGATGVTVNGVSAGSGDISAQWGAVSLYKSATNTWYAMGSIGTVA